MSRQNSWDRSYHEQPGYINGYQQNNEWHQPYQQERDDYVPSSSGSQYQDDYYGDYYEEGGYGDDAYQPYYQKPGANGYTRRGSNEPYSNGYHDGDDYAYENGVRIPKVWPKEYTLHGNYMYTKTHLWMIRPPSWNSRHTSPQKQYPNSSSPRNSSGGNTEQHYNAQQHYQGYHNQYDSPINPNMVPISQESRHPANTGDVQTPTKPQRPSGPKRMPASNESAESRLAKEPKVIRQLEANQRQTQESNAQLFKDQMAQVEPQPVQGIPTQPRAYFQLQAHVIEPQAQQTSPQEAAHARPEVEYRPLAQIQYQIEDQPLAQIQQQVQEQSPMQESSDIEDQPLAEIKSEVQDQRSRQAEEQPQVEVQPLAQIESPIEEQPRAQIESPIEDQPLASIQPQAQEQQVQPQAEEQPAALPVLGTLFKPNRYGAPKKVRKNSKDNSTSVDATSSDSVTPPPSFIVTLKLPLKPTFMVTLKLRKNQEVPKTSEPPKLPPQPKPKKVSGPITLKKQAQMLKDIENQMGYAKRALDELAVEQQSGPLSRTRKRKAQKKRSIIRQLLKDREELLNHEVVSDDDDEEECNDENAFPDGAFTDVIAEAVADVEVNPMTGANGALELNAGPVENGKYENSTNTAVETTAPAVSNEPDYDPVYTAGHIATNTGNPGYVYHGDNVFAPFPNHVPPTAFTHTPAFNPATAFDPAVAFDTITTFGPPDAALGFGPVNGNGPTAYNGAATNGSVVHKTAGHSMAPAGVHRRMQAALHRKRYKPKGILKWPPNPLVSDDANGTAFKRPHEDTGDDDIRDRKRVRFGDVTVWD